jgi:hypothetical protein
MPDVWRLGAAASLVVGLAVVGIAANMLRDGASGTIRENANGIVLRLPDGWQLQLFGSYCMRVGPGLLVSNVVGHRFRNIGTPIDCTNGWHLSELPGSFVLLDASFMAHPFAPIKQADTPVPLSLSDFRKHARGSYGGCSTCTVRTTAVVRKGRLYVVRAWVGTTASVQDKHELELLVRTLRFTSVHGR